MDFPTKIVIKPKKGWTPVNFDELWQFRELLYFLAWRDIKVRYKQTALGVTWAVLQPFLAMVVFSVLFGKYAKIPSEGIPYPIFVYLGLLPWQYFASVLSHSTNIVVSEKNMVTKIYFPRLIMPASSAVASLLDFLIASVILCIMMLYYKVAIGHGIFLVPVLVILTMINAVGFGLWFSALNVRYRDIQYAIPFLIQIWMFVTPVIYPSTLLDKRLRWILSINPMSGVIESFRPAVIGNVPIPWTSLGISTVIGLLVFIFGILYFRRVERYFADVI